MGYGPPLLCWRSASSTTNRGFQEITDRLLDDHGMVLGRECYRGGAIGLSAHDLIARRSLER